MVVITIIVEVIMVLIMGMVIMALELVSDNALIIIRDEMVVHNLG